MKIVVLIENKEQENLEYEHGLSIYIEYGHNKYLLDAGASDLFLKNAKKLSIPVEEIDVAVLSHGHYDHSGGFRSFVEQNQKASIWIRHGTKEYCYRKTDYGEKYIGIPKGMLQELSHRICYAKGDVCLQEGVYLIPHKNKNGFYRGKKANMFIRTEQGDVTDCFLHEQSLVFQCKEGLVVLNSCSHSGILSIIEEIKETFPQIPIVAVLGGFHLKKGNPEEMNESVEEVKNIGKYLWEEGIPFIYTGHCTGTKAFGILKEILGDRLVYMETGLQIQFEEVNTNNRKELG